MDEKEELRDILIHKSADEIDYLFWYVFGWMSKSRDWDNYKKSIYSALNAQNSGKLQVQIEQILEDQAF
jgi:hypothetical protein